MKSSTLVGLIHGALSTELCWDASWPTSNMYDDLSVHKGNYDICHDHLHAIANTIMIGQMPCLIHDRIVLVGHSYGGIVAVETARLLIESKIKTPDQVQVLTIATPFSGVMLPIPVTPRQIVMYTNVASHGLTMTNFMRQKLPCATVSVITKGGQSPFMLGANDGVVTEQSMMAKARDSFCKPVEVYSNHSECLLDPKVHAVLHDMIYQW